MRDSNTLMFIRVTTFALCLSIVMSILSAYIRLDDTGIGCQPWPACYGAQVIVDHSPGITVTMEDSNRGLRFLHRLLATVFGLLVLLIAIAAVWYRKEIRPGPGWPLVAVAITVILSWVGMNTPNLKYPIITTINLAGGVLLSMTLLHVLLRSRESKSYVFSPLALLSLFTMAFGFLLVVSGSWVSGNFTAASCEGFLVCGDAELNASYFAPNKQLEIVGGDIHGASGDAVITWLHHALALWFGGLLLVCTGLARLEHAPTLSLLFAPIGFTILIALTGTFAFEGSSLLLATAHNALSVGLLLSLVYMANRLGQQ